MSKISILGSGGWGIALALHSFNNGHEVLLWSPFEAEVNELSKKRENERLLKGVKIPEAIEITSDLNKINGSDVTIIATPSFAVRETAQKLKRYDCGVALNVAKGFEKGSMKLFSEVLKEELPDKEIAVLSGPSHAEEVARGVATSVVVSSDSKATAKKVQELLIGPLFRIYTNNDVIGVEVGGALKNVIAVCAGIANGLGVGDNTRAALITRGLAEIARLGNAMGADISTFMGLSGLGDLIVTCMSEHSRNNRFGNLVGQGAEVKSALETVGTVEGYYAVETAVKLAEKYSVEMPLTTQCYNILYQGASVEGSIKMLMTRPGKPEEEPRW